MTHNATPAIDVRGVGYSYGGDFSIYGVTFEIAPGTVCCMLGPNGSGKTTLFTVISGALLPVRGEVYLHGQNLHRHYHGCSRQLIAMPFHPAVYTLKTPYLYWQAIGHRYGLTFKQTAHRIAELAPQLDMTPHLHKPITSLSLGMQKKTFLVAAFIPDMATRMLDEPFSGGIDPLAMEVVAQWIESARQRGETILFSAQLIEHAQRLADTVLVLRNGKVAAFGSPAQIVNRAGIPAEAERPFAQAYVEITESSNL